MIDVSALPSPAPSPALPEAAASVPEFSEAYYRPRVEGMPETAPIYDGIRSVNRMESVAACIKGRKGCDCYTDFGTKVSIKPETCRDWAENSLPFNPYRREGGKRAWPKAKTPAFRNLTQIRTKVGFM